MISKFKVQEVYSLNIPELQPYLTLRRPFEHIKQGIFVAEGEKIVRRLLHSNLNIISMLMTPQWYAQLFTNDYQDIQYCNTTSLQQATIYITDKLLIETIVGFNLHQGIMAVGKVPSELSLDELLTKSPPRLYISIDGLTNAENVGLLVRNCVGFGADVLIVGETSSSPYLRRAVRNSMGTIFRLPVIHAVSLSEMLTTLKNDHGFRIICAHPSGSINLHNADLTDDICIVFGNENSGISPDILSICTETITIPMLNEIDSLNVACASAVFLYEVRKNRAKRLNNQ